MSLRHRFIMLLAPWAVLVAILSTAMAHTARAQIKLLTPPPPPMSPALEEFLSIEFDAKPLNERIALRKELYALTPAQKQQRVLAMYQAEYGTRKVPDLSLSGESAGKLLRPYSSHPALEDIIAAHAKSIALFYATWFPGPLESVALRRGQGAVTDALEIIIGASGNIHGQHRMWSYAIQGGGLDGQNLKVQSAVKQALSALPESNAHPALDQSLAQLLIVTYRTDKGWQTRLYDRSQLPESVKAVFLLTDNRGGGVNGFPKPW